MNGFKPVVSTDIHRSVAMCSWWIDATAKSVHWRTLTPLVGEGVSRRLPIERNTQGLVQLIRRFSVGRAQPSRLWEDNVPPGVIAPVGGETRSEGMRRHRFAYPVFLPHNHIMVCAIPRMA